MRKTNILFIDWGLSRNKCEKALSTELKFSIFNIAELLKEQLSINDDLTKELRKYVDVGKVLSTEILGKFISKNIDNINGNILINEYPRTVEQFEELKKILLENNIELENIWHIKQREPNKFREEHFENPKEQIWINKLGSGIIDNWKAKFKERSEQITEIKKVSEENKWKVIEMDYVDNLSTEYIQQRIKDCA